jgi:hypothetical protein
MTALLLVLAIIAVAIALYGAGWRLEVKFLDWVRKEAGRKDKISRFVIFPKEKRTLQRTLGKEFDKFWYNSKDECFAFQAHPDVRFENERDRWKIIQGEYDILDSLNWWQRYIYNKTGAWWYQGFWLQYEIAERTIDIKNYEPPTEVGKDGKMVPLKDNVTIYLFRTEVGYGVVISGAEDVTGNPVTVLLIVPARVQNPYIAEIEIKTWDTLFANMVRARANAIIHTCHFYKSQKPHEEFMKKYDIKPEDIKVDRDEIIEILQDELFMILEDPEETGGFECKKPLIQEIILENKALRDKIAAVEISKLGLEESDNNAKGVAAFTREQRKAENEALKNELVIMDEHPKMARLIAVQKSLGGANAISIGNDSMFFDVPVENKRRNSNTNKKTNENASKTEPATATTEPKEE